MTARSISNTIAPYRALSFDTRVREGKVIVVNTIMRKIFWAIRDWWKGGRATLDQRSFTPLYDALQPFLHAESEEIYRNVKELLHLRAKIKISGWERSLADDERYQSLSERIDDLRERALAGVDQWVAGVPERIETRRWVVADERQLNYAAYSNSLPLRSDEIPIGSILLHNPQARFVLNRISGYKNSFDNYIQGAKMWLARRQSGHPNTHAKVAVGGNQYLHLLKKGSSGMLDGAVLVDSEEPERLFLTEDVLEPNEQVWLERLGLDAGLDEWFTNHWLPFIQQAIGTRTSFREMFKPAKEGPRPEGYCPAEDYQPGRPEGYSCSGLINASFAAAGVDLLEHQQKLVDRAAPWDFHTSPYYQQRFFTEPSGS